MLFLPSGSQICILDKDASDFNPNPRKFDISRQGADYAKLPSDSKDEPGLSQSDGGEEAEDDAMPNTPTSISEDTSINTIDNKYDTVSYRFMDEKEEEEEEGRKDQNSPPPPNKRTRMTNQTSQ